MLFYGRLVLAVEAGDTGRWAHKGMRWSWEVAELAICFEAFCELFRGDRNETVFIATNFVSIAYLAVVF